MVTRGIILILLILTNVMYTPAQQTVGIPSEQIEAYPIPDVVSLEPDPDLLYDRIYRRVTGDLVFHDAPGGSVITNFGLGFNYVTLLRPQENEWAQVSSAEWIPSSNLSEDVLLSRYAGALLPDNPLPYTMAWTLKHLRAAEVPGGDPSENNPFLYRYTRVNLYTSVTIDGRDWYQIGTNQWVHQYDVARMLPVERPDEINTEKWVSVDLYEQVLIAYEGDRPVFSTLISSGLSEWPTNRGLFNVYLRRERTTMSGAYGMPDFYYLQEVPWTMFFDGDIALHGTYWHDGFGYRQSHGCVNMSITDSHWLFQWSADIKDYTIEDSPDLSVYVYSSGEYE
jgi:hypothetical protein